MFLFTENIDIRFDNAELTVFFKQSVGARDMVPRAGRKQGGSMTETRFPSRAAERESAVTVAVRLNERYRGAAAAELVEAAIRDEFTGRIALVSSFGSSAAVLLKLVAQADPATPVLFLDTGKHFGETLRYRDALVELLGLTGLRILAPLPEGIAEHDPKGMLWMKRPDRCCYLRKVEPLQRGLAGFDAWFTGRRRGQSANREAIEPFEADGARVKINPLYGWTQDDVDAFYEEHRLPRHPLEEDGFVSIGCLPCTDRVAPGEDARAGRWRGRGKTECGIHLPIETFKDFGSGI